MESSELLEVLADLPRRGVLVKDRPYRQVWRFEAGGQGCYLKFYPHGGLLERLRRRIRGSRALAEFRRLQWLQKAGVPAPRPLATLLGYRLDGRKGDALLFEAIEPAVPLDAHLNRLDLEARPDPAHRDLVRQIIDLLAKLAAAGLGHADLHLGNFLLRDGRVVLIDAWAIHKGGLTAYDLFGLAHSAGRYARTADLLRAWRSLTTSAELPAKNTRHRRLWRQLTGRIFEDDALFGHAQAAPWRGHFFRQAKYPQRWSAASRLQITDQHWADAWPILLQQIESEQLTVLKESRSGQVLGGEVVLGGHPVPVVVKRPYRRHWWRYLNEIGRGSRPRRAWKKAWKLVARDIPTAWPLLLMEKRTAGYVTDAMLICERIEGPTLSAADLDRYDPVQRRTLLHRVGRLMWRTEHTGMYLYDAKAENWMVRDDPVLGPTPMLIDVDGLRPFRVPGGGFARLLRSLRGHPQFTEADAVAVARGYRPRATDGELAFLLSIPAQRIARAEGRA